jgi:hypothetical protein
VIPGLTIPETLEPIPNLVPVEMLGDRPPQSSRSQPAARARVRRQRARFASAWWADIRGSKSRSARHWRATASRLRAMAIVACGVFNRSGYLMPWRVLASVSPPDGIACNSQSGTFEPLLTFGRSSSHFGQQRLRLAFTGRTSLRDCRTRLQSGNGLRPLM